MKTTLIFAPALVYFMGAALNKETSPEDALKCLDDHFLDGQAKRINDEVCQDLTLELVRAKRSLKNEDVTHEMVLNGLATQIS